MSIPLNAINSVKHHAAHKTSCFKYSIPYTRLLFKKTMSFAFRLIAIFALISIAYGNKAADKKKTESVKQGKSINLHYFAFLPKIFDIDVRRSQQNENKMF